MSVDWAHLTKCIEEQQDLLKEIVEDEYESFKVYSDQMAQVRYQIIPTINFINNNNEEYSDINKTDCQKTEGEIKNTYYITKNDSMSLSSLLEQNQNKFQISKNSVNIFEQEKKELDRHLVPMPISKINNSGNDGDKRRLLSPFNPQFLDELADDLSTSSMSSSFGSEEDEENEEENEKNSVNFVDNNKDDDSKLICTSDPKLEKTDLAKNKSSLKKNEVVEQKQDNKIVCKEIKEGKKNNQGAVILNKQHKKQSSIKDIKKIFASLFSNVLIPNFPRINQVVSIKDEFFKDIKDCQDSSENSLINSKFDVAFVQTSLFLAQERRERMQIEMQEISDFNSFKCFVARIHISCDYFQTQVLSLYDTIHYHHEAYLQRYRSFFSTKLHETIHGPSKVSALSPQPSAVNRLL